MLSRFDERIEITNPDPAQRQRLFHLFLGKLPVDFDRDAVARELSLSTDDIGGREIRNAIQKAAQKAIRRAGGNPRNAKLTREDLLSSVQSGARPPASSPGAA